MSASSHYKDAGVDIDAAHHTVGMMKDAIRATHTPAVLADVGSFGGLFALDALPSQPVLVASTDGVGTKVKLAADAGRWEGIGHDIVNHCINDILVQNARPLFFLDYVATSKLEPEAIAGIVIGIADACKAAGCALLGGETAEMPGVYTEGAVDVAGTVVGLVDRPDLLPRLSSIRSGDLLLGLKSSGPHTNGYSLIRRTIAEQDLRQTLEDGSTLVDALLAPHRCYLPEIDQLADTGVVPKALAHITGGGFTDNLPRILPDELAAEIDVASWQTPAVFDALLAWSGMNAPEAYRVFNMGIGMVIVVDRRDADRACAALTDAVPIGEIAKRQPGDGDQVRLMSDGLQLQGRLG